MVVRQKRTIFVTRKRNIFERKIEIYLQGKYKYNCERRKQIVRERENICEKKKKYIFAREIGIYL